MKAAVGLLALLALAALLAPWIAPAAERARGGSRESASWSWARS